MMTKRQLLEVSQAKIALDKLKKGLKEELQLSDIEITYLTEFYKEVKKLKLFESSYFKNFEYEGELFNLEDIQTFAKYPEAFYDIVMIVLHNRSFLDLYSVSFNGVNVELEKIVMADKKEKDTQKMTRTPYDQYKVAEDSNYFTFYVPNYNMGQEIRNFYEMLYPEDKRVFQNDNYKPTWCIISSSGSHHFSSEKIKQTDKWLVTFTKQNPADLQEEFMPPMDWLTFKKKKLGEVFLMNEKGNLENKSPNRTNGKGEEIGGDNYGYHNFTNNPYFGKFGSTLSPKPAYSYENIDLDDPVFYSDFVVEGGVLTAVFLNKEVIRVPQGVSEIATGAFSNSDVEEVILPPSTRIIRSEAFIKTRNLHTIRATNNLEVIESNAFSRSYSSAYNNTRRFEGRKSEYSGRQEVIKGVLSGIFFTFGVYEKSSEGLSISKPSQLRYIPKSLKKGMKNIQKYIESEEVKQEERKRKGIKESFRVKRDRYEQTELFSIEGTKLVLDLDLDLASEIEEIDLSDVEGIKELSSYTWEQYFSKLRKIVFPPNVEDISNVNFSDIKTLREVDLSNTQVETIPNSMLAENTRLRKIKLPDTVREINEKAFASSGIDSLEIPSEASLHPTALKNTPFLKVIYVDDVEKFKENQSEQTLKRLASQKIKIERK